MSRIVVFTADKCSKYHILRDAFFIDKIEVEKLNNGLYNIHAVINQKSPFWKHDVVTCKNTPLYQGIHLLLNQKLPKMFQNMLEAHVSNYDLDNILKQLVHTPYLWDLSGYVGDDFISAKYKITNENEYYIKIGDEYIWDRANYGFGYGLPDLRSFLNKTLGDIPMGEVTIVHPFDGSLELEEKSIHAMISDRTGLWVLFSGENPILRSMSLKDGGKSRIKRGLALAQIPLTMKSKAIGCVWKVNDPHERAVCQLIAKNEKCALLKKYVFHNKQSVSGCVSSYLHKDEYIIYYSIHGSEKHDTYQGAFFQLIDMPTENFTFELISADDAEIIVQEDKVRAFPLEQFEIVDQRAWKVGVHKVYSFRLTNIIMGTTHNQLKFAVKIADTTVLLSPADKMVKEVIKQMQVLDKLVEN